MKIQNAETIQSYFKRVSQIKEKLVVVEEVVIATLNGLPRSWDSFIQGMCAKRKLITFSRLWEECTQEEVRLIKEEDNMGATEYQALMIQRRKRIFLKR